MPEQDMSSANNPSYAIATLDVRLRFGDTRTLLEDLELMHRRTGAFVAGIRVLAGHGWTEYDSDDYRDDDGIQVQRYWFERENVEAAQALSELEEARVASDGWVALVLGAVEAG